MSGGSNFLTPGMVSNEYIHRDHVHAFTEKIVQQNEQIVHSFYAKSDLDPRLPIRKGIVPFSPLILLDDFMGIFKRV